MSEQQIVGAVYAGIQGVIDDICAKGIGKDGWNELQKYKFRGIDAVHDTLSPIYAKHKVFVTPRITSRTTEKRERQGKDPLYFVVVEAEYAIRSTVDGSTVVSGPFFGEAMDSGDKATNKAMSVAYKYFAVETWSIPLVGRDDPDAHGEDGLGAERIVAIEEGFKSAKTKTALRDLLAAAHDEASGANDSYAFKRFTKTAVELAAKIIDEPQPKGGKDQSEPQAAKSDGNAHTGNAGADPGEPRASAALVKMINKTIEAKGLDVDAVAGLTGGEVIATMSKSAAASLLAKVQAFQ